MLYIYKTIDSKVINLKKCGKMALNIIGWRIAPGIMAVEKQLQTLWVW
jgi:hypothetical protein